MAYRYGIDVAAKADPSQRATEWFGSRGERDEFLNWYRKHGRDAVATQEEYKSREEREHELALARASAPRYVRSTTMPPYCGSGAGAVVGISAGAGLALGVAIGSIF